MKIDLSGKTAILVGASGGLGEAMAHALADAGASLALVARNVDKLKVLEAAVAAKGGTAAVFAADLVSESDVARLQGEIAARYGSPQILINSAGTNIRKNLIDFTLEEFRSVVDASLISTSSPVAPSCRACAAAAMGRIINLASIMAHISLPGRTAYSSAKAAVLGLTRALALELAGEGITVNTISPGPFGTPMNSAVMNDPVANEQFLASLPIGRWGNVEEIGGLVTYLCSDLAGFITGADYVIDGGWTVK